MKLGYHGANSLKSDLETDIAAAAAAGYTQLEVVADKIDTYLERHTLGELKDLLVEASLTPATINASPFFGFRGEEFAAVQERTEELCRMARAIGCPTVVVVPGATPESILQGQDRYNHAPWPATVEEHIEKLQLLSAMARDHGVNLALEFLGFGWCSVRTLRGAAEIVTRSECDNVGIVLDTMHFYKGGSLLSEIDRIDPARIFTVHINDMEDVPKEAVGDDLRVMPGQGILPLQDIYARLKTRGYDGLFTIEMFRPEYWAWDPYKLAEAARSAALETLAPHWNVSDMSR